MADLQINIEYKNRPAKILLSAMTFLFPIWAIILPACLGLFIGNTIMHSDSLPLSFTVIGCMSLIFLMSTGILLAAFAEDKHIHLSKDGIAFPLLFLLRLNFRRDRNWPELNSAELLDAMDDTQSKRLILGFNSGEIIPLRVDCVKTPDLEQLFLAIELWANNCKRSPQLITFQQELQNSTHNSHKGYTQMWEEELSRRFTNTVFIPLEPEHCLQNGRIKIIRQLAFGGLSAIYLAQINDLDLVVLKEAVIPAQADDNNRKQAELHLDREADLLAKLDHPNIAHVLDHFVEDGRHYIVLEYVNGQDLRQLIKQSGIVSQSMAVKWAITIASILKFLHNQNPPIIHRDLTPDNLIRTNQGEIVLIDFGAANQFLGAATGTIVGKHAYIPPEQLRGNTVLQSDIYALGCTIYYLLTGSDPIPLAPSHPASINKNISRQLDKIIAQCTCFESEDRYQNASEVEEALQQLLPDLQAQEANDDSQNKSMDTNNKLEQAV